MARSNTITFYRGTRASLAALASSNGLIAGEPYWLTDESRIACGIGVGTFQAFAKDGAIVSAGLTMTTARILGRTTAATGAPEELTAANVRTFINVADGSTANSSDATLLARANHTGTQSADTLTDGTTNKAFLATERTKLSGIATGATANDTDANLKARANHTGTQASSTITGSLIGSGMTMTTAMLLGRTTAATGAVEELSATAVRSFINVANGATANSSDATLLARANHTGTQAGSTITGAFTASGMTMATATILGRTTAATGAVEELSAASVRTLINVANGATANSSDATLLARANHTGTQAGSTVTGAFTSSAMTMTTATMLGRTTAGSGAVEELSATSVRSFINVANGATANSSDATLLARANHTGTQASSTITTATARLLGRTTAGSGAVEELTVGNGIAFGSGTIGWSGSYTGNLALTGNLSQVSGYARFLTASAPAASVTGNFVANSDIYSGGTGAGLFFGDRSNTVTSNTNWFGWYATGATVFCYNGSSNIASINGSSGVYTALSDRNRKKNFAPSPYGLAEILQLEPKLYNMKGDKAGTPKQLGLIAQDVQNIIPPAYVEVANKDADGKDDVFIGLNERPIVATLIKAVQELNEQLAETRKELQALKERR